MNSETPDNKPKFNATYLLIGALIIGAYFIGSLVTKNRYLEKTNTATSGNAVVTQPPNQPNQPQAPAMGQKVNVGTGHLPVLGDKNAKVTVIEFADFRCPFCERYFTDTKQQLIKDYVDTGKVKFAFRHYAFLGPASTMAASATECANAQGKFWEFHDYLFKNQPPESDTSMYTIDNLTKSAQSLGIKAEDFRSCLSSDKYAQAITTDFKDGQTAGVTGTPATFINGQLLSGAVPYAQIKALVDQELAK
ncbi:MAG: DsbA family protein [Pseudorhodobacter sp.]|nr:DsbA family protein [Pseudorhodobacter sp.]